MWTTLRTWGRSEETIEDTSSQYPGSPIVMRSERNRVDVGHVRLRQALPKSGASESARARHQARCGQKWATLQGAVIKSKQNRDYNRKNQSKVEWKKAETPTEKSVARRRRELNKPDVVP